MAERELWPATVTEREALDSLERKRIAILRAAARARSLPFGTVLVYDPQRKEFEVETKPSPGEPSSRSQDPRALR